MISLSEYCTVTYRITTQTEVACRERRPLNDLYNNCIKTEQSCFVYNVHLHHKQLLLKLASAEKV